MPFCGNRRQRTHGNIACCPYCPAGAGLHGPKGVPGRIGSRTGKLRLRFLPLRRCGGRIVVHRRTSQGAEAALPFTFAVSDKGKIATGAGAAAVQSGDVRDVPFFLGGLARGGEEARAAAAENSLAPGRQPGTCGGWTQERASRYAGTGLGAATRRAFSMVRKRWLTR